MYGRTYGNTYKYYPDGTLETIFIRPNGNYGGVRKYFPNGKLRSCKMGNYYIEWHENDQLKWFVETDPDRDYYTVYNIMWDEYGRMSFGIFGIESNEYLEIIFNKGKIWEKFISSRYRDEPTVQFLKNGKRADQTLLASVIHFMKINTYENFIPEVSIPNIDWETYLADSGIPWRDL